MSRPKSLVLSHFDDVYFSALDALMESPLYAPFRKHSSSTDDYLPRVVYKDEDDDKNVYTVELPGFKESDIRITMENNVISIEAKRETPYKSAVDVKFPVKDIDVDHVTGNLENGILTLICPKKEESKPRRISLK
jgi:HSP20 family molecular chaperone IbpA